MKMLGGGAGGDVAGELPDISKSLVAPGTKVKNIAAPAMHMLNYGLGSEVNTAAQSPFRQAQLNLVNQLAGQAAGNGPSIAQQQFKMAADQNAAQQFALANSMRGPNQAAVARTAINQAADVNTQMAQAAAVARLQEMQQAQGLLGQTAGQGTTADLQSAQMVNQFDQQRASLAAQYAQMGMDAQKANQAADLQMRQLIQTGALGQLSAIQQAITGDQANKTQAQGNLFGALGAGAAGLAQLSDERAKEDIKPGDAKITEFLGAINAHDYRYKDEKHGAGRFVSPMAQELLKTEVGRSFVLDTEDGHVVDYGKGFGALLAAQASLNKRLNALEGKKAK
jgi:hypothetical protein